MGAPSASKVQTPDLVDRDPNDSMRPRQVLCLIGALSCAIAASVPPTSCGGARTPVTITVAGNVTTTLPDSIAAFERTHPHIRVELVDMGVPKGSGAVPTDRAHDLLAGYMATETSRVDVYEIDVVWLAEFADAGWLLPLDEYFTPSEREQFEGAAIDACTYAGRVWAVPEFTDFGLLYYRKDLLAEAGLSKLETWQDLDAFQRALANRGGGGVRHLYGFQGARYEGLMCNFLEALWGENGTLVGADGRSSVDSEEAIAALEHLVATIKDGVAPPWVINWIELDGEEAFRKGEIAVLRAWPKAWRTMQTDEPSTAIAGKVGVGLPLHAEGGQGHSALGGWHFAIAQSTPVPREAWELISFLCGVEQQTFRAVSKGFIPTRPSVFADPAVRAANPQFDLWDDLRRAIRPRPVLPAYRDISRILSLHVHKALLGEESPRDALRTAAVRVAPLLAPRSATQAPQGGAR
jgi:multiple sugar transport system substrate-binding protein